MINDARQYIWTQPLQMFWPGWRCLSPSWPSTWWATRCAIAWISSDRGARPLMPQHIELQNIVLQAERALVHGVSLTIKRGRVLALVGGSGSGKSLTCAAALGILPPGVRQTAGMIPRRRQAGFPCELRGSKIATIMQNPRSAFNPLGQWRPTRGKPAGHWVNPQTTPRLRRRWQPLDWRTARAPALSV
jgi:ABC-type antimicrobial peptide transport system ATPase subunit